MLKNFNNKTFSFFQTKILISIAISLSNFEPMHLISYISCKLVYYSPMDEKTLTVHQFKKKIDIKKI